MYGMYGLIARNDWMDVRSETSMKRKDNVVELAATHLHQSAIAENEIGKQPVAAVAEVARGAVIRKAKDVKETEFLQAALRSIRDILAARHVTLFSLSSSKSKSTPPLHLLHELSLVTAYGRECAVKVGEVEEGMYAAMILWGYEQARALQALIQGAMVMGMGGKKTVARSRVGECYR